MDTLSPADRVRIVFADASVDTLEATVCSTLSDQQEGLSPKVEDYVACWLEVMFTSCDDRNGWASLALGIDFQYTLDGRKITIESCPANAPGNEAQGETYGNYDIGI